MLHRVYYFMLFFFVFVIATLVSQGESQACFEDAKTDCKNPAVTLSVNNWLGSEVASMAAEILVKEKM